MAKKSASLQKPSLTLRERAEAAVRATRADVAAMPPEEIQRLVHELQVHQIELEMQNEELRQAHAELGHSRDRLSDLYDFAPVGYLTLDRDGVVVEANLTIATMLGVERGKLIGRKFTQFVDRAAQDVFYLHQRAVLGGEGKHDCDLLLRRKRGDAFFARMESNGAGESGAPSLRFRSAIIDITQRKQSEEAILQSHAELEQRVDDRTGELLASERTARAVVDALPAHIAIVDEESRILEVNARWRKFAQENQADPRKVCEGANYLAVCKAAARLGISEAAEVAAGIRDVLAGKNEHFAMEYPCHSPAEERWFLMRVTPFPGTGPRRAVISHENITARVNAERATVESEGRMRMSARAANIGLWDWNLITNQIHFFAEWKRQLGYADSEISDRLEEWSSRLHPDDIEKALENVHAYIANPQGRYEAEFRLLHKNGTYRWINAQGDMLRGAESKPGRMLGCHIDITDRKLAEEASRESEERYRTLFNTLMEGFCVIEMVFDAENKPVNYRFLDMNPAFEAQTGLRNVEGKFINDVVPDNEDYWFEIYGRVALTGEPARFVSETKSLQRWFEVSAFRVGGEESRKVAILFNDVTEFRRAEMALRESEEKYRQLIHALPAAIYTCDAKGRVTLYNAEAVKLWGREPKPADRWGCAHRLFSPDGTRVALARSPIAVAVSEGEPIRDAELIVERADGSRSHVLSFPDPIHDSAGTVIGAVNMLIDITAQKVTENALRTSVRKLRTLSHAVEQSPASVMITSDNGEIDYVNPKFSEVTGYSLEEVLGKNPRLLKSGTQSPEFYKAMWDTIKAGRAWRGEFCNRKKNGELFWEFAVIAPIEGEHGTVTHFVALKEDITERRRATEALAESKAQLEGIVGSAMDAIISMDASRRIILFNEAAGKMFRCPPSEAIGSQLDRFIPKRFHLAHAGHVQHFGEDGVTSRAMRNLHPLSAVRADGEEFPIEASISKIEVNGQKLLTVILRDVTERKRLEKEVLAISSREQRRIGQELHDDLCQWIAGSEFLANALAKDLATRSPADEGRALKIADALRQANARARTIARGLAPTILAAGLKDALEALAASTGEMFGIRCHFDGPEAFHVQDEVSALHLYRIVQEAISNAVRHGRAREVRIHLQFENDHVTMSVSDDGRGIPQPQPRTSGMGLRTMQYRAGIIGGTLEIRPGSSGGTEVICTFPTDL